MHCDVKKGYQVRIKYWGANHRRNQEKEWAEMKPIFLKKMQHKDIQYTGPGQLVNPASIEKVKNAWKASLGNLQQPNSESMDEVISHVERSIHKYLE